MEHPGLHLLGLVPEAGGEDTPWVSLGFLSHGSEWEELGAAGTTLQNPRQRAEHSPQTHHWLRLIPTQGC